ncbi:diguanylate cyclase [Vibrio makurazakiensis]|uniref:sensor domain-containing diguanylate cyclase n=1 Tax=Vibrio makurazakiensis TaxID=2910250 RepID=UPI003D0DB41E
MIYLAIVQLENAEGAAYSQSQSNIRTATSLINGNIEATFGKIYLLEDALNRSESSSSVQRNFTDLSKKILKNTPNFADILIFNPENQRYTSTQGYSIEPAYSLDLQWHSIDSMDRDFFISSVYQNPAQRWVFAVKHNKANQKQQVWVEFDLLHTTQALKELKTLEKGYVFVVDLSTEKLVFHPNPQRIGTDSISYRSGIDELISNGSSSGNYEYYYRDNFKVSVFDANNSLNWVFISGTDRSDILATSYQFTLTAIVIASLLLLVIITNYLFYQLNSSLADLNRIIDIASFKHHLKSIFDKFVFHEGVQFVLYSKKNHSYSTLDYHGNKTLVFTDEKLASSIEPSSLSYQGGQYADPLARTLKIRQRHYRIPLFSQDTLIAIIYVNAALPTYQGILRMIRDYSEVALSNQLLQHQIRNKDVMTQLDNKQSFSDDLASHTDVEDLFLALFELDNFEYLNTKWGADTGDRIIMKTADSLRQCFPKPNGVSLARVGGTQFSVLFTANSIQDAKQQFDQFRETLASQPLAVTEHSIAIQISAGISALTPSSNSHVEQAERALNQARRLGKNRVEYIENHLKDIA